MGCEVGLKNWEVLRSAPWIGMVNNDNDNASIAKASDPKCRSDMAVGPACREAGPAH